MTRHNINRLGMYGLIVFATIVLSGCGRAGAQGTVAKIPDVMTDQSPSGPRQTVVFAGGCFWGVQAVFQHVPGVLAATSGYAGGTLKNPDYETVSSGTSGHAESVKVIYDPAKITYGKLLKVFFAVAHNPTELNYQGPDHGTQYRSAVFYTSAEQQRITAAYIGQLDNAKMFSGPIVTQLAPLDTFYPAETYHQDYARLHPYQPYIAINDLPKVEHLKALFPELYKPEGIRELAHE